MGYIETLFGHQDQILALDCLPSLPTLPPISLASFIRRPPSTFTVTDPSPVTASAAAQTLTYARHPLTTPAETLLTVGARDKTARFWKVPEETQLVFRGGGATSTGVQGQEIQTKRDKLRDVLEGKMDALAADDENSGDEDAKGVQKKSVREHHRYIEGSLESVAMIDENTFLTGGDSGSICLWSTSKKKPVFTCSVAHGAYNPLSEQVDEGEIQIPPHPRWITALASLRYSDLFASGECPSFRQCVWTTQWLLPLSILCVWFHFGRCCRASGHYCPSLFMLLLSYLFQLPGFLSHFRVFFSTLDYVF